MVEETKAAAFDFDKCFSSAAVEEEGVDVPILRDDNQQPSGFVIRIAGPNSTRMRKALNANSEKKAKLPPGTLINNDYILSENLDTVTACTISWRYPEGFEGPPCTPENARKLYAERGGVRNQAWAAALNVSLFMRR